MNSEIASDAYSEWLVLLKQRIHTAQQRATLAVNRELMALYWQLGRDIRSRQSAHGWGAKVIDRLSKDLRSAFPEVKGFSRANLAYMRAFAEAWPDEAIVQQAVGQLPWGHNLVLLSQLKDPSLRLAYADRAIKHGWSRRALTANIATRRLEREGLAVTNFEQLLPKAQSDLARESLKDPYRLDFLGLSKDAEERAIEEALVRHITDFLIELGAGFAFVGRQIPIQVGGDDFYVDLLFYHLKLRCYVVIELKAGAFKPEHTGQLSFYMSAVDSLMKHLSDEPTIGLLLCKSQNRIVAEYALRDLNKPIGVAQYELNNALPEKLRINLPTIEEIEAELTRDP